MLSFKLVVKWIGCKGRIFRESTLCFIIIMSLRYKLRETMLAFKLAVKWIICKGRI